ncbi:hypothetical protein FA15DRAFT_138089 [Coprinopsis marcescibilis]|uniref:Uncharacterized protein n=1 Tax=Coprinopsis marcescibilis TaxID=230819 RepID=A0A5C3KJ59_COPMA|nr:hypothetical protein FA15DRAFT_138089 [Coprinopsis marcescibilis]
MVFLIILVLILLMVYCGLVWWESALASGAMYIRHKGSCSHRVNRCSSFFVRCPCDFFGYLTSRLGLVSYPILGSCWSGLGMWWCDRAMRRGHCACYGLSASWEPDVGSVVSDRGRRCDVWWCEQWDDIGLRVPKPAIWGSCWRIWLRRA